MDVAHAANDEQAKLWNGLGGRNWVEARELLDAMLKPFEDLLVQAVSARSAVHVLDVGCGAGSTTLAVARIVGANGRSVGIDISEPLIGAARARTEQQTAPARFIHADAQTYPFEPASFDMIISRFGVMFFDDPVRAFANLRRAAGDGAELRFIAWRSAGENPFMTAAERAAAPVAEAARAHAERAGPVRLCGPASGPQHPSGERLDRHRSRPARCSVHLACEGLGPSLELARSRRPGSPGGGRTDACAGHRNGASRL